MRTRSQPSVRARLSTAARRAAPSLATVEPVERRVLLSAGQLDPTFAGGGKEVIATGPQGEETMYSTVAAEPNGDLLVAEGDTITQLTEVGTPTPTFGTQGSVTLSKNGNIGQILLRPNGDIVVVGFSIEQLLPTGAIDTSFGTAGVLPTGSSLGIYGYQAALGADGTLVVASNGGLQRFTAAGQLDTTFGTNGTAAIPTPSAGSIRGIGFAVDANDGVVISLGFAPNNAGADGLPNDGAEGYALYRLTPGGQLDTTFGAGRSSPYYDGAADDASIPVVAIAPDGTIYTADNFDEGEGDDQGGDVFAFTATGGSLGGGAVVPGEGGDVLSLAVQPDGKLVAVGDVEARDSAETTHIQIARFEPASATTAGDTLDPSFGTGGIAEVDYVDNDGFGGAYGAGDTGTSVAVDADGDIIVGGVSNNYPAEGGPESTLAALQGEAFAVLPGTVTGTAGSYLNQG